MSKIIGDQSEDRVEKLLRESDNNKVLDEIVAGTPSPKSSDCSFEEDDQSYVFRNLRVHDTLFDVFLEKRLWRDTKRSQDEWNTFFHPRVWKLPSAAVLYSVMEYLFRKLECEDATGFLQNALQKYTIVTRTLVDYNPSPDIIIANPFDERYANICGIPSDFQDNERMRVALNSLLGTRDVGLVRDVFKYFTGNNTPLLAAVQTGFSRKTCSVSFNANGIMALGKEGYAFGCILGEK